jgi:hypothetical protein
MSGKSSAIAALAAVCWLCNTAGAAAVAPTPPKFVALSSTMSTKRYGPAAATTNGKVLVAGGATNVGFGGTASTKIVDLFDPTKPNGGAFTALPGPGGMLSSTRYFPFAAPLPGGKVLIGGGFNEGGNNLASASIYDPGTGAITDLPTGPQTTGPETQLHEARYGAWAAPLADGRVLIGGGKGTAGTLRSAEIFDPATNDFTTVPQMMEAPRYLAAAAPLPDGRVLIAGGSDAANQPQATVEIYNPTTGVFAEPPGGMGSPRTGAIAATLPDGKVLITGGVSSGTTVLRSAEIYNPADSSSLSLPDSGTTQLTIAREAAAAAPLPNGDVLIMGGTHDTTDSLNTAEVFEPAPEARATGPDFGSQTVGGSPGSKTVTITNIGGQALDIEGFALGGGNAADFSVGSSTCPSVPVPPEGTCAVTVKFAPSATGPRVGTLRLSDNETIPLTIIMKGTGTAPGGGSTGGGGTTSSPTFDVLKCHVVKVVHTVKKHHVTTKQNRCSLTVRKGKVKLSTSSIRAKLLRGTTVFATGRATSLKVRTLDLTPKRKIKPGAYKLTLTYVRKHKKHTVHTKITVT